MRRWRPWLWILVLLLGGAAWSANDPERAAPDPGGKALVLEVQGAIGPAAAAHVKHGLARAAEDGARVVILVIDTPGGLDASMREINRAILASSVPVASYVHPGGARAASAGTYILYASHVAAMTPGTNLGAATPVELGGAPAREPDRDKGATDEGKKDENAAPASPMNAKAVNDAVAYIRGLAGLRGRNADWAERAVREAASLTAEDALEQGVIDVIAVSLDDLLRRMDGRTVKVNEAELVLKTEGLVIERMEPNWQTGLLGVITDPNIAILLMTIGIYGLLFEFMSPGALYPGVIGAICLILGLYALAALPVNYAGFALIILGVALMLAELFAPSFGILGIGGAVAFLFGAAILVEGDSPAFAIDWPVIGGVAAASLLFTLLVLGAALRARKRRVVTGREQMLGLAAEVMDWNNGRGHVFVRGERWRAVSNDALAPGDMVEVTGMDGLTLHVGARRAAPR